MMVVMVVRWWFRMIYFVGVFTHRAGLVGCNWRQRCVRGLITEVAERFGCLFVFFDGTQHMYNGQEGLLLELVKIISKWSLKQIVSHCVHITREATVQ